ncbi:MAG TPA: putative baseplate assembly protein, partial [Kofleriaceae bacterium]|nr:putative baseplate assembly protein [Kofleriaceae bacterium]
LLRTPDAEIQIEMVMADTAAVPKPNPSEDLILAWDYFDGKRWRTLGRSSPRGSLPGAEDVGFHDSTKGLSVTGTISFRRPRDMEVCDVNGEIMRWLRVRIEKGDYGLAGNYTLDNERWVFKDERPLRPPAVRQINLRYREDYRDVRHVLVYNDFAFADVTETARTEFTIFQPFTPKTDESPAIYLGFADRLPNEFQSVYFHMAEDLGLGSVDSDEQVSAPELSQYMAERRAMWESEQRVVWEYWDGKEWEPLAVDDGTTGFTNSGFVDFVAPDDWQKTMKFTEERFWFRARLEAGGYARSPRVRKVMTNVVEAFHQTTIAEEVLGGSDASPIQKFKLLYGPLLEDEVIEVRERNRPPEHELEELGENAVTPLGEDTEECWVRWQRVESFYGSGPRHRHYTIDYVSGQIDFGDGGKGMIPPEGANNIRAKVYRTGGGSRGNVNAGTLTSLTRAIAYIDSVANPIAAAGGADRESVQEAKDRAPYTIKSRDRAVTAEDFEMLALRCSTSLARAKCVPDRSHRGAVTLVLVPKAETEANDMGRRLIPSNEVLRYVKRYLDDRRLVGTVLNVAKPRYADLSIKVTLLRRTIGTSDRLRREIEDKLRRFLHPLVGGRDGKGWEFGRHVLKTDLIHVVEEIPGVEGVDALEMRDEERGVQVEHVRLSDDELPYLVTVHVVEKVRDEIM